MKYLRKLLVGLLLSSCQLLVVSLAADTSESEPSRLAIHKELRVPVYYAAIHSHGVPFDLVTASSHLMTMEARYIVDKFSARRNARMWINQLLITNSRQSINQVEDAVLSFAEMLRFDVTKGDRLTFKLNPTSGTRVSLNGILLGELTDIKFQPILINAWFGNGQPSKAFEESISAAPKRSLLNSFEQLAMDPKRITPIQAFAATLSKKGSSDLAVRVAKSSSDQPSSEKNNTSKSRAKKNSPAKKQPSKVAKVTNKKPANTKSSKTASAQKRQVKQTNTDTLAAKNKQQASSEKSKVEEKNQNKNSQKNLKGVVKKAPIDNQSVASKGSTSRVVDQLLNQLRKDYQLDLIDYVERKAKPIPPRKVRKVAKGDTLLNLSIKKENGRMKLKKVMVIDSVHSKEIQALVVNAVNDLKSFPMIPDSIVTETILVDVSLNFSKCKRSTSVWICF